MQHLRQKRRMSDAIVLAHEKELAARGLTTTGAEDPDEPTTNLKYRALRAHVDELDDMGFVWNKKDEHWDFVAQRLVEGVFTNISDDDIPVNMRTVELPASSLPLTRVGNILRSGSDSANSDSVWSLDLEQTLTDQQRTTLRRRVGNSPQRAGDTILDLCEEEQEAWMKACELYVTELEPGGEDCPP